RPGISPGLFCALALNEVVFDWWRPWYVEAGRRLAPEFYRIRFTTGFRVAKTCKNQVAPAVT
ncbi:MAG: hypothetical protein MKZ70_02365, partial [Opitutales bacterium]|nr:hypothetical protein [Opitutales bacterium]